MRTNLHSDPADMKRRSSSHEESRNHEMLHSAHPDDPAILFKDVSVRYRLPRERLSGIKEYAIRWLQRRIRYEEFWALRGVSFSVRRGEALGVIGQNGAGKSTLLKVMARVLHPTEGRVVMRGRTAPLLELGGGFHPELSGRENVFLNLALLGHTRQESEALFQGIIDFAEIHEFINAPLRTYSTGMVARLGFSTATCVRPDILLIDEVLSVGDSRFQEKCLDRMHTFRSEGTTVVFVSHSMGTVEGFCDQVLWLERGQARALGIAPEVIDLYMPPDPTRRNPLFAEARPGVLNNSSFDTLRAGPFDTLRAGPFDKSRAGYFDGLRTGPFTTPNRSTGFPPKGGKDLEAKDYASLAEIGKVYPTAGVLNVEAGTISVWLKVGHRAGNGIYALFHSDDSRYVLFIETTAGASGWLVARAGGNRRAFDPQNGKSTFPEVAVRIEAPSAGDSDQASTTAQPGEVTIPEEVWRLATVTWEGYPRGRLRLYVGDRLAGEKSYDRRHDRGDGLPAMFSVGMRPRDWTGELANQEDGSLADLRPGSLMAVPETGLEIRDMRLYPRALEEEEILALVIEGLPEG